MKLKTFIDQAKLDWTDIHFKEDAGTGYRDSFPIRPDDFIRFAKADFSNAGTHGLVNALSNAKRAIDCQADSFLSAIGFDPEDLKKQLGDFGMASLAYENSQLEATLKFRLLEALDVATPEIIAKLRRLRNLLEHEYKKPRKSDVRSGIDIAELFVQACRGKMQSTFEVVWIGCGKHKNANGLACRKYIRICFENDPEPNFGVAFLQYDSNLAIPPAKRPRIQLGMRDEGFLPLLKLIWHTGWDNDMTGPLKAVLTELGFHLPPKFRVRRED